MNVHRVVVSMPHLALKFLILATKIGVIHANEKEAQWWYNESYRKKYRGATTNETHEVHTVESNAGAVTPI